MHASPFFCDRFQQCLLRIREFLDSFLHELGFHFVEVDQPVDLGKNIGRRQVIDLPCEGPATILNGLVGGGRIGFDVGTSERLDIFPGRIVFLLDSRTGEDDLLLEP